MATSKDVPETMIPESKKKFKRYITMYDMLKHKSMSAGEITQELEHKGYAISKRSVERDLKAFNGFNGLFFNDNDKRHITWEIDKDDFSDRHAPKDEYALAIVTAKKQLALTAPPEITKALIGEFERAERLLTQIKDSVASRWYKRVKVINSSHLLQPPKLNDKVFKCIRDAALNHEVIKFEYKRHSHDATYQIVATGLGLYYRGSVAYFIALNHEGTSVGRYTVSRIVDAAIQYVGAVPQGTVDFDLEEYEKENSLTFRYGDPFLLSAMIFSSVQREIEDAHLGGKQSVTPIEGNDKFKLLEVEVPYTLDLIQWLLARAPYLKVLGPPEFREKFDEEIKRAFANVKDEKPYVPEEKNFGS
jgi:predicted DNA-binding transcriptional regulator YafY